MHQHTDKDLELKRVWYRALKQNSPCMVCNETDPNVIELHHKHPDQKTDTVLNLVKKNRPFSLIEQEVEKCVPVCSSCHKKIHYGSIDLRFMHESPKKDVLVVIFNRSANSPLELVVRRDLSDVRLPPSILTAFLRNQKQLELF